MFVLFLKYVYDFFYISIYSQEIVCVAYFFSEIGISVMNLRVE